jgi:hypothetical protein
VSRSKHVSTYRVCSKSSRNHDAEQQCISHNRCCLSDLATLPLVTQAILFQVDGRSV